jgi:hypothetical protein
VRHPCLPKNWFSATKDGIEVDVAYFGTHIGAEDARKQLVAITKSLAKTYGLKVTDKELRAAVQVRGSVLYWWPESKLNYGADVRACLA